MFFFFRNLTKNTLTAHMNLHFCPRICFSEFYKMLSSNVELFTRTFSQNRPDFFCDKMFVVLTKKNGTCVFYNILGSMAATQISTFFSLNPTVTKLLKQTGYEISVILLRKLVKLRSWNDIRYLDRSIHPAKCSFFPNLLRSTDTDRNSCAATPERTVDRKTEYITISRLIYD